jgi:hypothetical protein
MRSTRNIAKKILESAKKKKKRKINDFDAEGGITPLRCI